MVYGIYFEWLFDIFFLPLLYICIKEQNEWLNTTDFHVIKIVFISSTWHIYTVHIRWTNKYISKLRKKLKKSGFVRLLLYYENVFLGLIFTAKKKYEENSITEVHSRIIIGMLALPYCKSVLWISLDFIPSAECKINFAFNSK